MLGGGAARSFGVRTRRSDPLRVSLEWGWPDSMPDVLVSGTTTAELREPPRRGTVQCRRLAVTRCKRVPSVEDGRPPSHSSDVPQPAAECHKLGVQLPPPALWPRHAPCRCLGDRPVYYIFYGMMILPTVAIIYALGLIKYSQTLCWRPVEALVQMHHAQRMRAQQGLITRGRRAWQILILCVSTILYLLYTTLMKQVRSGLASGPVWSRGLGWATCLFPSPVPSHGPDSTAVNVFVVCVATGGLIPEEGAQVVPQ